MITPDNCSLWIVNYKRPEELMKTVDAWMQSFPFENVNIIYNGWPYDNEMVENNFNVYSWPNIFRPDWLTGSLAWCWNQAMLNTFTSRDYCIMSQDDVDIKPGWHEKITDDYWTYIAPHGDVVTIQSLKGFNRVGWFDERFRAIGGAECDYMLRMMRAYPDQLSIHDEHIWQMRHNDVGLAEYFHNPEKTAHALDTRTKHNLKFAEKECFSRWIDKWGQDVDNLFLSKNYNIDKRWNEIDWYPALTAKLVEIGRKEDISYEDCL